MKVLVAIKRVISPYVKIRVKPDGSGIDTERAKMAMNPFDEIAVEEAIRLKEKSIVSEVIVVSVGDSSSQEVLRNALAIGADRAVLVENQETLEPINIAKILKAIVLQEDIQLVILGKQSIDGDNNQTPQMLATLLGWPQGVFISSLTIESDHLTVVREVDGGLETLRLKLPAVLSTDLRLNQVRYPSLPNIMKAKQKPLQIIPVASLGLTLKTHTKTLTIEAPPTRAAGQIVTSVTELVAKLKDEAKVI